MRRIASVVMLASLLVSMLILTFNTQPAEASSLTKDGLMLEMEISNHRVTMGEEVRIKFTITNVGNTTLTRTYSPPLFDAYYLSTSGWFWYSDGKVFISVILDLILEPGENYTTTLRWDLYQFNYKNGEVYPPVPGTYDLCGYCYLMPLSMMELLDNPVSEAVTLEWWDYADLNHDFEVDIFDIVEVAGSYGSEPFDPKWNPRCDIAEPYGIIDMFDIVMITGSYGEEYNP